MTRCNAFARSSVTIGATLLIATGALAQSDAPGATDPAGMTRFPGAWIIEHSPETRVRSYEYIIGQVARISREVRIDRSMRTTARLSRATYRTPSGTRLDDVVEHYEAVVGELGGRVDFTCSGQECGHSTLWANQVFGVKELAAPDAAQFYLATTIAGSALGLADADTAALVSIYVVQRPNRRVNAHVDFAVVSEKSSSSFEESVVNALNSNGFAIVGSAVPDPSGELDEEALKALADLAPALAPFANRIAVVCHLGSLDDPTLARRLTEACAVTASERLGALGVQAGAFGAGAYLPRDGAAPDRLELVIPGAGPAR